MRAVCTHIEYTNVHYNSHATILASITYLLYIAIEITHNALLHMYRSLGKVCC